jgi:DNA-binding transcriptional MerR regulator
VPVCIYFPLLRNQIDSNGFVGIYPQYEPNEPNKYVGTFNFYIKLNNNGEVRDCSLGMWRSGSIYYDCSISWSGYMPSWRFNTSYGTCDLTRPFRFVGAADCEAPDEWIANEATHNANYLFLIVKPALSNYYNIKGIGCGELRAEINRFSDFSSNYEFRNKIYHNADIDAVYRITFLERGYSIEEISSTLDEFEIRTNDTCFVLVNESLIEDASDFISLYQVVNFALTNSIVCYIGNSVKVPDEYKNKVIHSDAIVTDLDTNEQMPLVIKYIRYTKRLYNLFNS